MNPYSIYEKHLEDLVKWGREQEFNFQAEYRIEQISLLMGLPMAEELRIGDIIAFYIGALGFVPKISLTANVLFF